MRRAREGRCCLSPARLSPQSCRFVWRLHFFPAGVLGLGVFLEMVGILEGLAPGRRGVSDVSEQAERVSMSSEVSEASLPLRLLARLPARLPARLAEPLAEDGVRLVSEKEKSR